jgi:hypothetical protein
MSPHLCRVGARIEVAVIDDSLPLLVANTPLSERARVALARSPRANGEMREALGAMLDAIAGLEREISSLRARLLFKDRGIEPSWTQVEIGGDSLRIPEGPWSNGQLVTAYFSLPSREGTRWYAIPSTVMCHPQYLELTFTDLPEDLRDTLVAFVFRTQAEERRRELASISPGDRTVRERGA